MVITPLPSPLVVRATSFPIQLFTLLDFKAEQTRAARAGRDAPFEKSVIAFS